MKLTLHRGDFLFHQGEKGDLFQLESGLLKVIRLKKDGNPSLLNILVPGEIFPHHNLVSMKTYHGSAIALTTCEVQKIPVEDWYRQLEENPQKYLPIALTLESKLRMMQQRIDILTSPPRERLSLFRQWLASHFTGLHLEELFTQEEIAQFVGLSRETVNRMLREKKNNGF